MPPPLKNTPALNGISFAFTPGLYGLVGPAGSGKTTFMQILAGHVKPDGGSVLWNGKNMALQSGFAQNVGTMPHQQLMMCPAYTGFQFLSFIACRQEIPRATAVEQIYTIAEGLHLTPVLNEQIFTFNPCEKQRLLTAGALLGTPSLLLLNYPTATLALEEQAITMALLAKVAKTAIVVVSAQTPAQVEHPACQTLLLNKGTLVTKKHTTPLAPRYLHASSFAVSV
ncbi:ATP-binding cassette domain-containing protein [Ruminococcaceae bacterium OttesenSCG-928-A16]|nr:ATP-binding cassette domain-containing protein [Ruminococcaceae bacterium OttesenSCG-928-A16]